MWGTVGSPVSPPLHVGISLGQDWFMYFLLLAS